MTTSNNLEDAKKGERILTDKTVEIIDSEIGNETNNVSDTVRLIQERADKSIFYPVNLGAGYEKGECREISLERDGIQKLLLEVAELRSSPESAITEFVKNCLQADSPICNIYIDRKKGEIAIEDAGTGISQLEIKALPRSILSSLKNIVSGSNENQGIGMFEFTKVGNELEIITNSEGEKETKSIIITKDKINDFKSSVITEENSRFRQGRGTTAYIKGILPALFDKELSLTKLKTYIGEQLRGPINEGTFQIKIHELPASPNAKIHSEVVQAKEFKGFPSARNGTYETKSGEKVILELYLFPNRNPSRTIDLQRGKKNCKEKAGALCEIEDFNILPWNSGYMTGVICGEELIAKIGRGGIKTSGKQFEEFKELLLNPDLNDQIAEEIKNLSDKTRTEKIRTLFSDIKKKLCEALASHEDLLLDLGYTELADAIVDEEKGDTIAKKAVKTDFGSGENSDLGSGTSGPGRKTKRQIKKPSGKPTKSINGDNDDEEGINDGSKPGIYGTEHKELGQGGEEGLQPGDLVKVTLNTKDAELHKKEIERVFLKAINICPSHTYFEEKPYLRAEFDKNTVYINTVHPHFIQNSSGPGEITKYALEVSIASIIAASNSEKAPDVAFHKYFDVMEGIEKKN